MQAHTPCFMQILCSLRFCLHGCVRWYGSSDNSHKNTNRLPTGYEIPSRLQAVTKNTEYQKPYNPVPDKGLTRHLKTYLKPKILRGFLYVFDGSNSSGSWHLHKIFTTIVYPLCSKSCFLRNSHAKAFALNMTPQESSKNKYFKMLGTSL